MAEVRKRTSVDQYKIDTNKVNDNKKAKVNKKKKEDSKKNVKDVKGKKSLWTKFRIFCHGVKSETLKVHWPSKKDMIKYSIATVVFIVFCSLFFYLIDVIFALVQSIFN